MHANTRLEILSAVDDLVTKGRAIDQAQQHSPSRRLDATRDAVMTYTESARKFARLLDMHTNFSLEAPVLDA